MGSIILSVGVITVGIAIGLLRGGQLDALGAVRPRWWGLLVVGFVLQAIAEAFDVPGAISVSVIGTFGLIVGLTANVPVIRGAFIAAFGQAMNLLVMVANGAVPVRFEALTESGIVEPTTTADQVTSVGHLLELETADTRLSGLGDVIPLSVLSSVISIGDLVTYAGVIVILSSLVAARRRGGIDVDELFARPAMAISGVLDLDTTSVTSNDPSPVIVLPEDEPIDLTAVPTNAVPTNAVPTYDPDDLWAEVPEDEGIKILGPSSRSGDRRP